MLTNFKLNYAGVGRLLKADVVPLLMSMGNSVAAAAGPGHEVELSHSPTRARVIVRTETFEAMRREASTRSLTRAFGAAKR